LSRRARILVLCGLAVVTALLAVAPRPFSTPFRRLANYRSDGPNPLWDARPPLDSAAIRKAGELIPHGATYWIYGPGGQYVHDLQGAGLLFFPALAVGSPKQAQYVFSYEQPRLLPQGVRAARVWQVGPRIYLVKLAAL
jgi:hypothetical protein